MPLNNRVGVTDTNSGDSIVSAAVFAAAQFFAAADQAPGWRGIERSVPAPEKPALAMALLDREAVVSDGVFRK
jgi:hypothetical protein